MLSDSGYIYRLECLPEDIPPEGNASAIDETTDAEILAWIHSELAAGNEWAWCCVKVTCEHKDLLDTGLRGYDSLGGCSYKSEYDFRTDEHYQYMCETARQDLEDKVKAILRAAAGGGED